MFAVEEYGVVTFIYSVVALVMVIITYGMETGFFRFSNHERWNDPDVVYGTSLTSLATSSTLFALLVCIFATPVAKAMECPPTPSMWPLWPSAWQSTPSWQYRSATSATRSAPRFALLRLVNIGVNIGLNLFFILLCPELMKSAPATVDWFPRLRHRLHLPGQPDSLGRQPADDAPRAYCRALALQRPPRREMIRYSAPLLVLGVAGIMDQTIDKILYPHLVADPAEAMYGAGIYGANWPRLPSCSWCSCKPSALPMSRLSSRRRKTTARTDASRTATTYFVAFALLIYLG